jgi:hypothetical protein
MQQTVAPPAKPYSELLGVLNKKVAPKWDGGASTIFNSMEELKNEGYLTRWNSAGFGDVDSSHFHTHPHT